MDDHTAAAPGARVADLTWIDVEARLSAGAIAIVPIGAASKEHGPHLPMSTDFLQAEWLADNLASRHDVLVWPTVGYGHYPAFVEYPGSCSVPAEVFRAQVTSILGCICASGARATVVINTGISTIKPLEAAVAAVTEANDRARVVLANIYYGPRYEAVERRVTSQSFGSHADEIETSIMLAMWPDKVDMTRAQAWDQREFVRGKFRRTAADEANYAPLGVYGDPTRASVDKGRALIDAMVVDLDEILARLV